MTDITTPPEAAPRRLRLARAYLISLLVALVVAGSVSVLVYANTYQPLGPGNFGFLPRGALKDVIYGDTEDYIITGRTGSSGSFGFSIADTGPRPVAILGAAGADGGRFSLRWVPIHTDHQEFVEGSLATSRAFPAPIRPGGQIEIYVIVRRPACRRGEASSFDEIPLQWEALGVHHVYVVSRETFGDPAPPPVDLCYPSALGRHIAPD